MTERRVVPQTILLVVIIIIAALSLGAVVAYGYAGQQNHRSDRRIIVRVDNTGQLSIAQAARTECRSVRAAALDKARWGYVADLFVLTDRAQIPIIGSKLKALPDIDTLTNKGGVVGNVRFAPCPPSIAKRHP